MCQGLSLAALPALIAMIPAPAMAQVDARLQRIEAQLRALQRQVFPGGDGRFFEPEITPQAPTTAQPGDAGAPGDASAPGGAMNTTVLRRLDAIEGQLARLTSASEENQHALGALAARLTALEAAGAVPTPSPSPSQAAAPIAPASASPIAAASPAPSRPAASAPAAGRGERPATAAPAAAQAGVQAAAAPSADRLARVQAITKPITDDRGDDEYVYGFRLWEAGLFPEAQQQLALFVENFPGHARASFGRNLLGRAFLDAGDPRGAATHFFENFQSNPQGARAADSLLFLAEAMIQLNDTRRACIALAEFGDTYPALGTGRLAEMYRGLVGRVECS